jgi:hypothetical protein
MNPSVIILLLVSSAGILCSGRRLATIFFLLGILYLTKGPGLEIGGVMLHPYRLLLLVGVIRILIRGEKSEMKGVFVDKLVLGSVAWLMFAQIFHEQGDGSGIVYNLGVAFEVLASYFLIRIWCRNLEDVDALVAPLALMLVPIALSMIAEKSLQTNPMGIFGGGQWVNIREGVIRSRGTFAHAILAGSFAAACFPIVVSCWNRNKIIAIIGGVSATSMVITCHSSGPLVSFVITCAIMASWRFRHYAKAAVWCAILGYLVIDLISNRPGYHAIVTRLDLTGSSTAYYRCLLIDTAIAHFNEWWLIGTDFTAHWVQPGVGSIILGGKHMDITNMYIGAGVSGGILSVLMLFAVIAAAVRNAVILSTDEQMVPAADARFSIWCFGAALGSLGVSGLSTSFFDQSGAFIWIFTAIVSSSLEGFHAAENLEDEVSQVPQDHEMLPERSIAAYHSPERRMGL